MLFCLERLDTLPAADLAIQVSDRELKNLSDCPTDKEPIAMMEPLRLPDGAGAHLLGIITDILIEDSDRNEEVYYFSIEMAN